MINQNFKALGRKYQVLPNFGSVAGAKGAQSCEFLGMRAQFLLWSLMHIMTCFHISPACATTCTKCSTGALHLCHFSYGNDWKDPSF